MPYHNGMKCDECGAMVGALTFTPLAVNADGAIEVPCPKCGHGYLSPVPEESGWLLLCKERRPRWEKPEETGIKRFPQAQLVDCDGTKLHDDVGPH